MHVDVVTDVALYIYACGVIVMLMNECQEITSQQQAEEQDLIEHINKRSQHKKQDETTHVIIEDNKTLPNKHVFITSPSHAHDAEQVSVKAPVQERRTKKGKRTHGKKKSKQKQVQASNHITYACTCGVRYWANTCV